MSIKPLLRLSILVVIGSLGAAGVALADSVTYWNGVTLAAVTAGRAGPPGSLDIALVHAAMYDAVQSIEGTFEPYKIAIEGASGSPDAAAGAAARRMLVRLYPPPSPIAATVEAAWTAFLAANPGLVGDPGLDVGEDVAEAMMAFYRAAPSPAPAFRGCEDHLDGCQAGEWRPTPSYIGSPPVPAPFASMTAPWAGGLTPFTLMRSDQFRGDPPPPLTSGRYVREYQEVKTLGAFASTALTTLTRTPDQTILAYFWSGNFFDQWNRVLRNIAEAHVPETGDRARLFALANLAVADAFITAWESKVHFNFWRPVTAIQEGDFDGNPKTDGDPNWQPLINNPPYPDYTSGANNVTGAMTRSLALFFGTDIFDFTITSTVPQLTDPATRTRRYSRFSQAADEVVDARILLGIHFRSADADARQQGERVAHWVFKHFLRPVHGNR